MRQMLILGGGTAGTMMANKLANELDENDWTITVLDATEEHYYQPGFLFVPFGTYRMRDLVKPRRQYLPAGVRFRRSAIDRIDPEKKSVFLESGATLRYDCLIIATGTDIHPEQIEGLKDEEWGKTKFDFYTPQGADQLGRFFKSWQGGRLVLSIAEMPIKCPVAPLEFLFLADAYFTERGIRHKVDLRLVTPLSGAFTKPASSKILGEFLERKGISVTPDFGIARVDNAEKKIVAWDDIEVPYDVLVSIPTNMGDAAIERSGMGNEFHFVPTDQYTLKAQQHEDIFVIGDATNLPSSKAGSVAHFQSEILLQNILEHVEGRPPCAHYDGHANCFIESGFGKGLLIDFNYETEPLPGDFPLPGVGPFKLLQESPINHYGKMMFRWVYWNLLLRGMELPIETEMSMAGKQQVRA
jgi:sulfide:quinone oxidoreductase